MTLGKTHTHVTVVALAVVVLGSGGCSNPTWLNFVWPIDGVVSITFVNDTPYTVETHWGGYNHLDPSDIEVQPLSLGAGLQSFARIACYRRIEIAGSALRHAADVGKPAGIDPDDINEQIEFLEVPEDTEAEPTLVGSANSVRFELAVDYFCNSDLTITFKLVPGTTDQFTVELTGGGG